jgi:hypothetical protein
MARAPGRTSHDPVAVVNASRSTVDLASASKVTTSCLESLQATEAVRRLCPYADVSSGALQGTASRPTLEQAPGAEAPGVRSRALTTRSKMETPSRIRNTLLSLVICATVLQFGELGSPATAFLGLLPTGVQRQNEIGWCVGWSGHLQPNRSTQE